jgi:acetyl esterase/lipase
MGHSCLRRAAAALAALLTGCGGDDDNALPAVLSAASGATQPAAQLRDVAYTEHPRRLVLDLYTPAGDPPFPVIVWVHGGGWRAGDEDLPPDHPVLRQVARGYAVASVEYRLSQEAVFPAQIEDCKAAVRWLRGNATTYGLDPTRVAAWGSSAGGHLAALLGTSGDLASLENPAQGHAAQSSRVQAVVDWYGPADFTQATIGGGDDAGAGLLGCTAATCPDQAALASPVTHVDPTDPPFFIQHGTADRTVSVRQSERLHQVLSAAGVPVTLVIFPGAGHGGAAFTSPANVAQIEGFLDGVVRR